MPRKPLILASLLLAAFAINVDTTIVNVALPALVRELHASNTQLEWIVDAYNLMFQTACLVAAVSAVGAILAAALIPAQPPRDCIGEVELEHVRA